MAAWVVIKDGPSLLDLMLSDYHRKGDSKMLFPAEHDSHPVFFSGRKNYRAEATSHMNSWDCHDLKCYITGGDLVETEVKDEFGATIPEGARYIRGWGDNGRRCVSRFEGWYNFHTRRGLIRFND